MDVVYEYHRTKKNQRYPLLVEVVTQGEVTMYADVYEQTLTMPSFGESNNVFPANVSDIINNIKTDIYFKRDNEQYVTKLKGRFKKTVVDYFGNCTGLIERVDNHEFGRPTVEEMVNYYNDFCTD